MKKLFLIIAYCLLLTAYCFPQGKGWWWKNDDSNTNAIDTSSLSGQLFVIASQNYIEVNIPEQTDYSVSVWLRIPALPQTNYNITGGATAKGLRFFSLGGFDSKLTLAAYQGSWIYTDIEFGDYKWRYCTITYESTTDSVKLYIDGIFKTKAQTTDGGYQGGAIQRIGAADAGIGDRYFGGNLANVAVWSRALTISEIQSIMNKQYEGLSTSQKNGLLAWWALDDISGAAVPDKTGNYNGIWH